MIWIYFKSMPSIVVLYFSSPNKLIDVQLLIYLKTLSSNLLIFGRSFYSTLQLS